MTRAKGIAAIHDPDEFIPTRMSLLTRLRDLGDEDGWRDFFHTYWHFIYGIARKSGLTEVEAQEVVQETIIAVSKQIPGFHYDPAQGSFKGWLWQITNWRIADQFRKRQRDQKVFAPDPPDTDRELNAMADPNSISPALAWEEEWQKNLVQTALEEVKKQVRPKQYQIFDLSVVKHWPSEKITAALGVNIGQVYLARHRITRLLKAEVKRLEKDLNSPPRH